MAVQSYLNLYTWLLGWQLYDQLWAMLANLGFLAIPFAFIAIKAIIEPLAKGTSIKQLSDTAVTRLVIYILVALFVLLFAGVPMVELKPSQVNYKPSCDQTATTVTANHTNTTYDNLITIPDSIRVPLWWYLVMAVSNGITDQAKSLVSCPVVDLRALQAEMVTTPITSAQTKAEIARFRIECYLPAYNRYLSITDPTRQQVIAKSLKTYGADDLAWIGSETLQTIPGFYDALYAQAPVQGFPYMGSDQDQIQSQASQPQWGSPSCKTWWQDSDHGLRFQLYRLYSGNAQQTLAEASGAADLKIAQDAAIYSMLVRDTGGTFLNRGYSSEEDSTPENFVGKIVAEAGADWTSTEQFPKIHMLQNMLPIFQALVEFLLFTLLSILLVFSGYSLRFVMSASFFMFAVIFMSFLWHTVTFIDTFLMQAMYQTFNPDGTLDTFGYFTNILLKKANPHANTLDFVVSTFYVGSTLFFLFMAGWIGWKGGTAIAGNSRAMEGVSESAGGKSSSLLSVATKLIK